MVSPKKKQSSISDVAQRAGVSVSTASKALRGTGSISRDTVERVLSAAEALQYRPNRAAQLLAGKNKTVGLLLPTDPPEIYRLFEEGARRALGEYAAFGVGYHIVHYDRTVKGYAVGLSRLPNVNGLIFIPAVADADPCRLPLPSVPKIALQVSVPPALCPSVSVDAETVGAMAAEFLSLTAKGPKTAVITGYRDLAIHRENITGFLSEGEARSLQNVRIYDSFDDLGTAYRCTEELLSCDPDVSGIFVTSYVSPAVCACLADKGYTDRVRVVGVDVTKESAACLLNGTLTAAIYQNQPWQAKKAVDLLLSLMRDEEAESVRIKPELVLKSNLHTYL